MNDLLTFEEFKVRINAGISMETLHTTYELLWGPIPQDQFKLNVNETLKDLYWGYVLKSSANVTVDVT